MSLHEFIMLKEAEEQQAQEDGIMDKVRAFFKDNAAPTDDEVHALAIKLDLDKSALETKIYGLLGSLLQAEAGEGEEGDADVEETTDPEEIDPNAVEPDDDEDDDEEGEKDEDNKYFQKPKPTNQKPGGCYTDD
jgi:hypothetical protein